MLHLYIEVLKRGRVPPEQVCRVLGEEADAEQTLHPLEVSPMHHLGKHVNIGPEINDHHWQRAPSRYRVRECV